MNELKNFTFKRIIIVGVGGTGSHLTSFLCQLVGNDPVLKRNTDILLIDGDEVELKNIKTQKFLPSDVGKKKAEVLADRYSSVFDLNIQYCDEYLTDENFLINSFLGGYSNLNIIISCVDNNKCRRIIDKVFNTKTHHSYGYHNVMYIDTGNSSGSGELTGQTVIGFKDKGEIICPSVSTFFPQMLDESNDDDETISCGEEMTKNIQNIGANITSATTVFNIINNVLCFKNVPANLCTFNATRLEAEAIKMS